jgi:hypothetical protein
MAKTIEKAAKFAFAIPKLDLLELFAAKYKEWDLSSSRRFAHLSLLLALIHTREEDFAARFIKGFDYTTLNMSLIWPDHSLVTVAMQFTEVGMPDYLQKLVATSGKCWQLLDAVTVAMMWERPEQVIPL